MMGAAASLFSNTASRVFDAVSYFKGPKVEEKKEKSPIEKSVVNVWESVLEETDQTPAASHEVGHSFAPVTAEEKNEGTLQKIIDTAKETIQSKATTFSGAAAKYSKVFADQALSRLSKFGLAAKNLVSNALMSPLRAANVPVQLVLGFGLMGQYLYRSINPSQDNRKYDSENLKNLSLNVFANAFASTGATVLPVLGNTIGFITGPLLNTKHFTGKIGVVGTKMLMTTQIALLDPRKDTTQLKKEAITSSLRLSNNPKILSRIKAEEKERLSFLQEVKLIFASTKIKHTDPIQGKYELRLKEKKEIGLKGGSLFFLAKTINAMSLGNLAPKIAFYIKTASDPTPYDRAKQEMQSKGEVRTRRDSSGNVLQRPRTKSERELDAIVKGVERVQNQETVKPDEKDRRAPPGAPAA